MYNFKDLIAKSYLKYTKEKDTNIAVFFYQEQYQVRPDARAKFIYSEEQFYDKLIKKIELLYFVKTLINIKFSNLNQEN